MGTGSCSWIVSLGFTFTFVDIFQLFSLRTNVTLSMCLLKVPSICHCGSIKDLNKSYSLIDNATIVTFLRFVFAVITPTIQSWPWLVSQLVLISSNSGRLSIIDFHYDRFMKPDMCNNEKLLRFCCFPINSIHFERKFWKSSESLDLD